LDSLLTRLTVITLTEPLDIDGFLEALASASLATTATPTTSEVVQDLTAPMSPRAEVPLASNSTIELPMEPSPSTQEESPICTPPSYQINEDELVYQPEEVPPKTDFQQKYEQFQKERRAQLRGKQRQEDAAFHRLERGKHNKTLYTGYN